MLKSFETRFLFAFTRIFTHILIALLALGMVGLLVYLLRFEFPDTKVMYDDVISSLQSPYRPSAEGEANGDSSSHTPSRQEKARYRDNFFTRYKVAKNVQMYFSDDENFSVLEGWLDTLNEKERDDFLKNLTEVINQAEKTNPNTVPDVINEFKTIKVQKIGEYHSREAMLLAEKGVIVLSAIGISALIALFTLVLVLLAVERNTRCLQERRASHE